MERVRAFHGYPAPGVVIGCMMVEAAKSALPDAMQMPTRCTIGNG